MSAPTTTTDDKHSTPAEDVRAAVSKGMHLSTYDRGLPAVYRSALDDPLADTPGDMLAVLGDVADPRGVGIAELAARDALALWATVSRALHTHHDPHVGSLGRSAYRAGRKHSSAVPAAMDDLSRVQTRTELLPLLNRILRLCQSAGAGVDYLALAESLYLLYRGTPTTELHPRPLARWVRDYHVPPPTT